MRTRILATTAAAAALVAVGPGTASAADTTTTFTVTGAPLVISAPASANLGSGQLGGTITGQLGTVTVTDQRGASPAAWTATVSSTNFTTNGGGPTATIPNENVRYWSGAATQTSGAGTFTPGQATAAQAVTLNSTQTAFGLTGGSGGNSASWNPTLSVHVPATVEAGPYTGTVTHSVA